ncbi:hypothetical protein V2A60_007244 [Cordyceps javanica]
MTTHDDPYKREEFSDNFGNNDMSDWKIQKGQFQVSPEGLSANDAAEVEAIIYRHKVTDFIFEADLTFQAANSADTAGDAGLVFRATHAGEAQQGYTVGFSYAAVNLRGGKLILNRMPGNMQLASTKIDTQEKETVHLMVQAINEAISVYVGSVSTPQLVQKDATFENGFNDVKVSNTGVTFSNIAMIPMARQREILDSMTRNIELNYNFECPHCKMTARVSRSINFIAWQEKKVFASKPGVTHSDYGGDVQDEVALSVVSPEAASSGDCPRGKDYIIHWEKPGRSGEWFGYGYTSRDACCSLWTNGWKFGSLHLRCADPWLDCVSLGTCVVDDEPEWSICDTQPRKDPPAAFKARAVSHTMLGGFKILYTMAVKFLKTSIIQISTRTTFSQ